MAEHPSIIPGMRYCDAKAAIDWLREHPGPRMVGQRSPGDEPRTQIVPLRTRIGTCAAYLLRAAPTSRTMALEPG
jgi:hypothetical protein